MVVAEGTVAFIRVFREHATQLRTLTLAIEWDTLRVRLAGAGIVLTAVEAAAWASRGFYPGEAEPSIRAGITAAMDRELEAHAEREAGGPDDLAAKRIADMLASGELLREDQVVRVVDPLDPAQEIVVPRDELS